MALAVPGCSTLLIGCFTLLITGVFQLQDFLVACGLFIPTWLAGLELITHPMLRLLMPEVHGCKDF